ncbi:uncharacterized protein LOC129556743 isoform X2 [Moschus berezovskii]|uniref:uncharacterized protein LOC129556743 isoform X2 n=1 Tax=Moschus berezovskii TaxID=68408 RepID=UPI0024443AD1|nr:uncharacterized protein LOC129556743 isoform X2 [Moschus berezovskii]
MTSAVPDSSVLPSASQGCLPSESRSPIVKKPRPHGEAIHKCSSSEPWLKSQIVAIIDLCMNKISDDSSPQPLRFPDFMDYFSLRTPHFQESPTL